MDKLLHKMKMVDYYVDKALEYAKLEEDTDETRKKFNRICEIILEQNDPFIACCFASGVSHLLNGTYEKIFDVERFQDVVMQTDDDEVLYKFGRDVKGADIKRITDRLPRGYAKKELLHDMKPIGEEVSL